MKTGVIKIILTTIALLFAAGSGYAQFSGGTGATTLDPYLISTPEDLAELATDVNGGNNYNGKFFKLTNDIDLTAYLSSGGAGYDGGAGWMPIGYLTNQFNGSFDGDGYAIYGLTINRPATDFVGLFGFIGGSAVIHNLGINIGSGGVTGQNNVGGLVGFSFLGSSIITNSYVTGAVTGTGNNYVGGLVGVSYSSISNSYATGTVTGAGNHVGGLVGSNGTGGSISNSYAAGTVNGAGNNVGGLAGSNYSSISNSYATGTVTGAGSNVGGFIGNDISGTLTDNFFDYETTAQVNGVGSGTTTGVADATTAEMQTPTTYPATWNFTTPWGIDNGYPYLAVLPHFIVTFNEDGGSTVDNVTVNAGTKVTEPAAPTRTNHTFDGWYVGATAWNFATPITAATTLTAHWTLTAITTQPVGADIYVGDSYTLTVVAVGTGLQYQWYKDGTAITGATSGTYTINNAQLTNAGEYSVTVTDGANNIIVSNAAKVNVSTKDVPPLPLIQRKVTLPHVQGIATNPAAGSHYVRSREDFVFEMWALPGYSRSNVTVTTDRSNEVIITEVGDGRQEVGNVLRVTIKHINAETTILISGIATGIEQVSDHKFTAYPSPTDGPLTITGLTPGTTVRLYSIVGTQVTTFTAEAATITIDLSHLARGLYLLNANERTIRIIKN